MKIKRLLLFGAFIACTQSLYAQIGYTYKKFSLGFGMGNTTAYADTKYIRTTTTYNASLSLHLTPYFTVALQEQFGNLAGGDTAIIAYRWFQSSITATYLTAQLQAGEFLNYSQDRTANFFKNFYLSTGIGMVNNTINRINNTVGNSFLPYYLQKSCFSVPLSTGYEFKLFNRYGEPAVRLDFSYTIHITFGDGLDGYYQLSNKKYYDYLAIAIKVGLGPQGFYRKSIPYPGF